MKWQVKYNNDTVEQMAPLKRRLPGDVGFDLYNASDMTLTVIPGKSTLVPAGLSMKLPDGYGALVYPRSSTFKKKGLFVIPGLIDCDYTGQIYTLVWNSSLNGVATPVLIEPWERLSQLILIPIPEVEIETVDELPSTERGEGGFGSTGL
ncbi:dUTP diphosphatase [Candidatus Pacearchaeota archaeon]|nr:dUTP diphosphatase [Candidatus Pacearchaeota archaeon]